MHEIINVEDMVNMTILFGLVVTAIAVVWIRNLLVSTILLSLFSLLMATEYLILGAADVAITEAAVGAGISTILLLLALGLVGHEEREAKGNLFIPSIVSMAIGTILVYVTGHMPEFGSAAAPAQSHVSPYYIEHLNEDIGIPNIVTGVLASYRGFDTFGETVVIFTAAISVLLLLGNDKKEKKRG